MVPPRPGRRLAARLPRLRRHARHLAPGRRGAARHDDAVRPRRPRGRHAQPSRPATGAALDVPDPLGDVHRPWTHQPRPRTGFVRPGTAGAGRRDYAPTVRMQARTPRAWSSTSERDDVPPPSPRAGPPGGAARRPRDLAHGPAIIDAAVLSAERRARSRDRPPWHATVSSFPLRLEWVVLEGEDHAECARGEPGGARRNQTPAAVLAAMAALVREQGPASAGIAHRDRRRDDAAGAEPPGVGRPRGRSGARGRAFRIPVTLCNDAHAFTPGRVSFSAQRAPPLRT